MKKLTLTLTLFIFLAFLSGCIYLIVGGVGAVGGYAVTRDTVQGEYDVNYSRAWKSALETCNLLGAVTTRDSSRGLIEATIDKAKVRVEVTQLTPEAIRLKVKARKGIFPRLGTAERVFVKTVQRFID